MLHALIFRDNWEQQPLSATFGDDDELEYWLIENIQRQMRDAQGLWAFWMFRDLIEPKEVWQLVHTAVKSRILRDLGDWEMSDSHPRTKPGGLLRKPVGFAALHFRRRQVGSTKNVW